jgi:hypothetical protein
MEALRLNFLHRKDYKIFCGTAYTSVRATELIQMEIKPSAADKQLLKERNTAETSA